MQIEPCTLLDDKTLNELINVWEKSVRSSHFFLTEKDIAFYKPLIRNQYLQAVRLFVIRDENQKINAFLGLSDEMIEMLFVDPTAQRRGLGSILIDFAYEKENIKFVDVNEDNKRALSFYLKKGYKIISRDAFDNQGKPFPILHLKKS